MPPPPRKKTMTFSVRETPTRGSKGKTSIVPLVRERPTTEQANQQNPSHEQEIPVPVPGVYDEDMQLQFQDTKTGSCWRNVSDDLLHAYFEDKYMHTVCIICSSPLPAEMHIQCSDCGADAYFCSKKCLSAVHMWNLNPLHKPKEFKVSIKEASWKNGCASWPRYWHFHKMQHNLMSFIDPTLPRVQNKNNLPGGAGRVEKKKGLACPPGFKCGMYSLPDDRH